ncbi:hypothetical protein OSG_eHP18_00080 [environmental Halophage eHP-18]|nr:hypothetical protein OSG_eHP18_00080 [environmental Halophage eHP-18]
MPGSRSGHHGDIVYAFEPSFNTGPSSPTFKTFGGNATVSPDGDRNASRIYNADRKAAQIIPEVFNGSFSVTHEITDPMWYVSGILGEPTTANPSGSIYEHTYSLANDNDPKPIRVYLPTEGFNEYTVLPGCVITSLEIDTTQPDNPEATVSFDYAAEPFTDTSLDPTPPAFSKSTFSNRDGSLDIGGDIVARLQNANISVSGVNEMVNEVGAGARVDFRTGSYEPDMTFGKIIDTSQTVDPLDRFTGGAQVTAELTLDNGQTGDSKYQHIFTVKESFPDGFSESGRNDPDADLTEELDELGQDLEVQITVDVSTPPTP